MERIPGGKARGGKCPRNVDKVELAAGIKVEMEHTGDRRVAREIACDHLTEDGRYYSKLATIHLDGGRQLGAPKSAALDEGRRKALLAKPIRFEGRQMTKAQMIEELVRRGGVLKPDCFPKYTFSRTAYNRMGYAEQRAYDEKMRTKMPFAVELPRGSFLEITQTEADYFKSLGGQLGIAHLGGRRRASDRLRDQERPAAVGYELDRETLTPVRAVIRTDAPGDYGADPVGDGTFRMVPSGDIVDFAERNRRLKRPLGRSALRGLADQTFTALVGNKLIGTSRYVGTFASQAEAQTYVDAEAARSRRFATFEIWTGTPQVPRKPVAGTVAHGLHGSTGSRRGKTYDLGATALRKGDPTLPEAEHAECMSNKAEFGDWDGVRVEILRRSKDGKRLYVSWWGQSKMDDGKLRKAWIYSTSVRPL